MRTAAIILTAAFFGGPALAGGFGSNADRFELRLGAAFYDQGLLTRPLSNGGVANGELLFRSPDFLKAVGAPRPYVGVDIGIAANPIHFFYAGLNWDHHFTRRFYVQAA